MTADIELLPLPEHPGGERLGAKWNDGDMYFHARAVAEHNAKKRDAEIEALWAEAIEWRGLFGMAKARADKAEARAERLAEALRLIAAPKRQDGTWNRDREACRQIAAEALRDHDQEEGSGAFWGPSPKVGGPDWTGYGG